MVKELYNENYKSLKKELMRTLENGRTINAHGLAELIL
jgi:hypothetical protein